LKTESEADRPTADFPDYHYEGAAKIEVGRRAWRRVSAVTTKIVSTGTLRANLLAKRTTLSIVLEEVGGRVAIDSNRRSTAPLPRRELLNAMSLIPAGTPAWLEGEGVSFLRHLTIQFDEEELVRELGGGAKIGTPLTPRLMFFEPRLLQLAKLFATECEFGEPCNAAYGDLLTAAMLVCLDDLSDGSTGPFRKGGMKPKQLKRVTDYLEENLGCEVSLAEMAAIANMSVSFFGRAFKASTGTTPHKWHMNFRIAKAQELLVSTPQSLADVAFTVGFCDQSHFTRAFQRIAGISPGAWRRERKS
jgi:AraC-like DNA-binding protein